MNKDILALLKPLPTLTSTQGMIKLLRNRSLIMIGNNGSSLYTISVDGMMYKYYFDTGAWSLTDYNSFILTTDRVCVIYKNGDIHKSLRELYANQSTTS